MWQQFVNEVTVILTQGGWLMVPLAVIALLIYWTAFESFFFFSRHGFWKLKQSKLIELAKSPVTAEGEIRQIVEYTQDEVSGTAEVRTRFAEIKNAYLSRIDRRYRFLMILVTTAPLMGLLGTVTGMLTTFQGLAVSRGGQTVDLIAGGISEALITTQTGLIIAIPAYVMAYLVQRRRGQVDTCLTHLESITMQIIEKSSVNGKAVS